MKKLISMGLSLILITSLFAGCGQQEPVASTPAEIHASAAAIGEYSLPEKFTGEWTGVDGFLHVTADASIEAPYGLKIPIATVEKKQIGQEEADLLLNEFLGDAQLYEYAYGNGEDISEIQEKAISRKLKEDGYYGLKLDKCHANTENGRVDVVIFNPETDGSTVIFTLDPYSNTMRPNAIPAEQPPAISQEEAKETADTLLDRLGLTHYLCQSAEAVTFVDGDPYRFEEDGTQVPFGERLGGGYDLFYVPSVSGIPAVITENAWGSSTPENEHIERIWPYEWIKISVNDQKQVVFF